ncbi:two-component regulator propeller domain-containing protein [Spirosoma soli]|uniref:Two-component regulator propeller domain-containing protein n=1 Tax=Spirosoma soli TaxID=1770529 RepID=A0ABW5LWB7_9BACT
MARCTIIVLLVAAYSAAAETSTSDRTTPYFFEHYTQTNGLSQGSGYATTSFDGFRWFATQDGLNRFDGYNFTVFRAGGGRSVNANFIQALLTDKSGRFWVGTTRGLNLYTAKRGGAMCFDKFSTVFSVNHLVDTASIEKLLEDKKGGVWIMTDEQGLYRFNPQTRQVKTYLQGRNALAGFTLAPDGTVWVATDREIYYFDPVQDRLQPIGVEARYKLPARTILRALVFDTAGRLWIGTYGTGVFVIENPRQPLAIRHYTEGNTNQHLSSNDVVCFLRDKAGRIWIGTRTGGISIYDPIQGSFSQIRHTDNNPRSLGENYVLSFYEDEQSNVWIGLSGGGIDKYDPRKYSFHQLKHDTDRPLTSLADNMVFSILEHNNDLYIGTQTGGMNQYSFKTNQVKTFLPDLKNPNSILHGQVYDLSADAGGRIWLATGKGLCSFTPVNESFVAYPYDKASDLMYLYTVQVLRNQTEVWTGGHQGLARFDVLARRWKSWTDVPALAAISNYVIRLIHEDSQGHIWLGTFGHGLIRYDPVTKKSIALGERQGLLCANIFGFLEDNELLWVGTDCGLFGLDKASLTVRQHVSTQGKKATFRLPNDVIYGILKDDKGLLWLSSNKGLTCFSPEKGVIKNYDINDGLQSNEFNTNCAYKRADGTLFFGGVNGINFFRPNELKHNAFVPPVRITNVTVLDSTYAPNQDKLLLRHDQNFITFEFTALNFSNTEKNQYQYRLEGIDKDWVDAQYRHTVNYTKLPSGEYMFRVKGSNDDGVWNEQGASILIVIKPPFWGTWWFRLLLIVLLIGGLYGIYWYRIRMLKLRQVQELAVSIRTQELERQRLAKELHDGVGANLAVLKMYLNALGTPTLSIEELKTRSAAILKASLDDIRSIIHDIHPRSLAESGLVLTIADLVELMNESKHLNVMFDTQNVPAKLPESIEINLFRVIQELLQNALKHANASTIWLYLRCNTNTLSLTYRDNGRGLDMVLVDRLSGNGRVNMRQRIALLKGTCHIDSVKDQGTTVDIVVPLAG